MPPGPPLPQGPPPGYAGPPGPPRPSQPPFGGPQPAFQPYGPPYGAARRRSKKPLLIIPLIVVLLVGLSSAIGVIVHLQGEPKRFLEAWALELGEPQGLTLYNGGQVDNDGDRYYALWRALCINPGDCANPSPFESVAEWLKQAGNGLSELQVRECYREELNCQQTIVKDGHRGVISLDQSSVNGNQFDMEIVLFW